MVAEEVEAAGRVRGGELVEEQAAEQARERADWQEEAWPAGYPCAISPQISLLLLTTTRYSSGVGRLVEL
jgi:hypothetical protein